MKTKIKRFDTGFTMAPNQLITDKRIFFVHKYIERSDQIEKAINELSDLLFISQRTIFRIYKSDLPELTDRERKVELFKIKACQRLFRYPHQCVLKYIPQFHQNKYSVIY